MGFIPTRMHGLADYAVGIVLILAPYLFGFATGGVEQWLPMLLGLLVIVYSMLTRYEWGLIPVIRMPVHLGLDAGGGLLLALSPWLFGFADQVFLPHLILGLLEIGAAAATSTRPQAIQWPSVAGRDTMAMGLVIGIGAVLAIVVVSAIAFTGEGDDMVAGQDTARVTAGPETAESGDTDTPQAPEPAQ